LGKVRLFGDLVLAAYFEGEKPKERQAKRSEYARAVVSGEAELYQQLQSLERAIAFSQTSKYRVMTFVDAKTVFSTKAVVVTSESWATFAALQSRTHELWSTFFGSTMKDDPVYTPSDCFETFPVPENWETHPALEATGKAYYDFRAAFMVRNKEGLTKTYNRFHDPDERDADILKLRELHAAMDRAVLEAYGWTDIPTDCEFLLDYEIDEAEWGDRKKPYRYRWPDEVRDEVLARLLELNAERAREEARSGAAAAKKTNGRRTRGTRSRRRHRREVCSNDAGMRSGP
jgi:hypothetical protein